MNNQFSNALKCFAALCIFAVSMSSSGESLNIDIPSEPISGGIITTTDKLVHDTAGSDDVNEQLALGLYQSAYASIPSGGSPHIVEVHVTYLDGSTVHGNTIEGIGSIAIDEKGTNAHCTNKKHAGRQPNLQKVFECLSSAHGGSIAETFRLDDGAGLTMNDSRSDFVDAGYRLWQKEFKQNTTFVSSPELTLIKQVDYDEERVTISRTLPGDNTVKVQFVRTPWTDDKATVTLTSIETLDPSGSVLKSQTLDANLGTP